MENLTNNGRILGFSSRDFSLWGSIGKPGVIERAGSTAYTRSNLRSEPKFRQVHLEPHRLKSVLLRIRGSSGIAIHRRMTYVAPGDHVDHILGDVRGMIGDAFEILGYQDQLKRGKHDGRVAHHVAEQFS